MEDQAPQQHVLQILNLKKSYRSPEGGLVPILDIADFSMEKGEQLALAGRSGSGKTTFLNLVAGILRADSGMIYIEGEEVTRLPEAMRDRIRANRLGYGFQSFNLLPAYSALENVLLGMRFGPGADQARAQKLLRDLGLGDRLHYKPKQLSIGQQQRVALARALANKPALVLADEPTGSLDQWHAKEAIELLRSTCEREGAALLLVSHDTDILGQFDRQEDLSEISQHLTQSGASHE